MIIASAQINLLVGDIEGNAQRIIDESHRAEADLILFPELALCGYPPEDLVFRPGLHERCKKSLDNICSSVGKKTIVVGYPEYIDGKLYNCAAVIHHKKIIATYSKQCLPNYTVFDEKRYFTAGHETCVFEIAGIHVGLLICEDIWFAEPALKAKQAGAEILVVINASPYNRDQVQARETMLGQRANETQLPIVYNNMVGGQDELVFDGGSMVIDAQGIRTQQAPYYEENIMTVKVTRNNHGLHMKASPLPARLTESENIYKALTLGIHDYVTKNHFPGVLIGLSGGIDSALTLAIACDALGPDKVIGVLMPSTYTATISIDAAKAQAERMGIRYFTLPIHDVFTQFNQCLSPIFKDYAEDLTEQNLQARIRGTLLMALSNKLGYLVLTTSNKSEMAVGYATLYGDMAGGFAALKDVPKQMVYQLAYYRNDLSPVIPDDVLTRAPSAELTHNQTDQDTLPPYEILDDILYYYVEKDYSPNMLIDKGFDKKTVMQIVKLVHRNEYKRRQSAPGVRLTQRAFGKDRRYPITSGFVK